MNNYRSQLLFKSFTVVLFCLTAASLEMFAQTNRPRPTPTPVRNEVPEIISRADDYQNDSGSVQPGIPVIARPTGSLEEKIDDFTSRIGELNRRITTLESDKEIEYDRKQKRLLLNLDILSRSEQRSQALREQLYALIEKESEIRLRLLQLQTDLRPEMIERVIAFAGSLRPEELRAARRKALETESTNLQNLLDEMTGNRVNLEENVVRAEELVEKLRLKLEKEIDEALAEEERMPNN